MDKIKKELLRYYLRILFQYFQVICDRIDAVHKIFYASGFIYYPPTKQILLHQHSLDPMASSWSLFSKQYDHKAQPEAVFIDVVSELLPKRFSEVCSIYSYMDESSNTTHSLLYALAKELEEFAPNKGHTFQWFTFKEIVKLPLDEQTKHDIVVGQRVIEAASRKEKGEHTFQ